MNQASQQIARQFTEGALNKKNWGPAMYNVLVEGLAGDGVTDDTVALQVLINKAVSENRKAIFFPSGTYFVTSLSNAEKVSFFGDNAKFVGGLTFTIPQIGALTDANIDGGNFDDPYLNPVVNGGSF